MLLVETFANIANWNSIFGCCPAWEWEVYLLVFFHIVLSQYCNDTRFCNSAAVDNHMPARMLVSVTGCTHKRQV